MTLLRLAVVVMIFVMLIFLVYEFWRLLLGSYPVWPSSPDGAFDLKLRHQEVNYWFSGRPVYGELKDAAYPPASYVILWPLLGWLAVTPARWLWAITTVVALVWLICLIVRESGANTSLERLFVVLMPLSMYATGATVGNGQIIVHLIPALVAAMLVLRHGQGRWFEDLWVAFLFLVVLVKPTVAIPFFWIVLFIPGRLRPALIVVFGYGALTFFAASFQKIGHLALLKSWTERALAGSSWESVSWSSSNLHGLFTMLGLGRWNLPISLILLAALGIWIYRHRRGDIWLLLSVTALISRFWCYHAWYDDLLILLPMIALFRIAKGGFYPDKSDLAAGVLLGITMLTLIAPGGLYLFPPPWNRVYMAAQTIVWLVVLIFLLNQARCERKKVAF